MARCRCPEANIIFTPDNSKRTMKCLPILLSVCLATPSALSAQQPNVIIILTDDQGYGDIAAHGNPVIRTPHLD